MPRHVINRDELVPRTNPAIPGVIFFIRPCSRAEFESLLLMAKDQPIGEEEVRAVREVFQRHVANISGLYWPLRGDEKAPPGTVEVELDTGGRAVELTRGDHLLDVDGVPLWIAQAALKAIVEGSQLSERDAGNSERPSSGAGTTAGRLGTAPAVSLPD